MPRRKELEQGTHRYTMPNNLVADTGLAKAVDGPTEDDPNTTFAVPLYEGESLIDYQQHRVADQRELEETVRWISETPKRNPSKEDAASASGRRPPIAQDPQTPEERGKKGAHSRKSKYAKKSKN